MIPIYFVIDGNRDSKSVPALVEKVLQRRIRPTTEIWYRMRGQGYDKKIRFAVLAAEDEGAVGVVAVIDRDNGDGTLLRRLKKSRDKEKRQNATYPIAVGEANPHLEAWLLDDSIAVRDALSLSTDVTVQGVLEADSPKNAIDSLIKSSASANEDRSAVLGSIAKHVEIKRFKQPKKTGFQAFQREVETEFQDHLGS